MKSLLTGNQRKEEMIVEWGMKIFSLGVVSKRMEMLLKYYRSDFCNNGGNVNQVPVSFIIIRTKRVLLKKINNQA